jgi:hypothetical protein
VQEILGERVLSLRKEVQICPWIALAAQKSATKLQIQNQGMRSLPVKRTVHVRVEVQFHPHAR